MAIDCSYVARNDTQRRRLRALVLLEAWKFKRCRRRAQGLRRGHGQLDQLTEPLGDETLVFLDYGGPTSLVAKVDAEEKVSVGDRRGFTFRPDRVVFFDGATGDRILR